MFSPKEYMTKTQTFKNADVIQQRKDQHDNPNALPSMLWKRHFEEGSSRNQHPTRLGSSDNATFHNQTGMSRLRNQYATRKITQIAEDKECNHQQDVNVVSPINSGCQAIKPPCNQFENTSFEGSFFRSNMHQL
jgi:hypothetical protein